MIYFRLLFFPCVRLSGHILMEPKRRKSFQDALGWHDSWPPIFSAPAVVTLRQPLGGKRTFYVTAFFRQDELLLLLVKLLFAGATFFFFFFSHLPPLCETVTKKQSSLRWSGGMGLLTTIDNRGWSEMKITVPPHQSYQARRHEKHSPFF